jgi:hypothetical protein
MVPRMKRWSMVAALCSLTAVIVLEREAHGGGAITITGNYKPVTPDPLFLYTFTVTLNAPDINDPGTNTFKAGDFFKIDRLPGVDASSLSSAPPTVPPTVVWSSPAFTAAQPQPSAPYASDVAWFFAGTAEYMATTPPGGPVGSSIVLGTFSVESAFDFPPGVVPVPSGTELSYSFTVDGVSGSGMFPIFSVPEPSSVLLMAVGVGMLPTIWLRDRRRRQKQ